MAVLCGMLTIQYSARSTWLSVRLSKWASNDNNWSGLTRWQTDRPRYSVGNNRRSAQRKSQILLLSTATISYNKYLLEQSTKIHNACLSIISVHQIAPPITEVGDIQLHLTWVVRCNWMSPTSIMGGAIWWTLMMERQALCICVDCSNKYLL